MYGVSVNFYTQSKLIIASNSSARFISDEGVKRRGAQIEVTNQFVDPKEANPSQGKYAIEEIKSLFEHNEKYRNALVFLILVKTKKYYEAGLTIPKDYKINFETVCAENDKTKDFIDDFYIITNDNNDLVSKHEILSNFNNFYNSKFDWKYLSDGLKRLKIVYDKDKRCNGMKGCLRGLRELTDKEREQDDPVVKPESKGCLFEVKPEIKPEIKPEVKPEVKPEIKPVDQINYDSDIDDCIPSYAISKCLFTIKQIKQESTPDIPIRMHTNKNKPKQQKEKCAFVSEPKQKELLPELDDVFKSMESEFIINFA